MRKIKWGILGAGWIADKFVSDFKLVDNGEVVAVAARSIDKAKDFAARFKIAKAYGGYDDLVKDEAVDIIYIATTHNFHFTHSKLCLDHGKHVLCEKPATVNAKEFIEISRLAKSKNLFYMEAMWTVFLPVIKQAMQWVAEGKIGDVEIIQANFGNPASPEFADRLFSPDLAGGALLDIGIYPLTIIELFANSSIKEYTVSSSFTNTNVDESLAIQLDYKNGVKAQLATSIKNRLLNDAIICGSKGMIQIKDFWMSKKAILTQGDKETIFIDDTDTMGYNCETVVVNSDLLNGNTENAVMPMHRTQKMMELMDDIRASIGLKYPFE